MPFKVPEGYVEIPINPDYVLKKWDYVLLENASMGMYVHDWAGESIESRVRNNFSISHVAIKQKEIGAAEDEIPNPPDGFVRLENYLDYKLKEGDYAWCPQYAPGRWFKISGWRTHTPRRIMQDANYKQFIIAVPGEAKPRFKTDKPYPYGY